jgi:outer membrane protein, heavy metal efflux system
MVVRIPRACASQRMRRDAWTPLFFAALAALVTSCVSTTVHGQAATPPPRAPGQSSCEELVPSEKRPDDGLTLNQAVERFLKENLELKALRLELPMAEADIEAAGQAPQANFLIELGANGVRTSRVQARELVPRRWFDTLVARTVKRVLEAQYEDAVRNRVDTFYTAFTDLDAAQRSVKFNEVELNGLDKLLEMQEALHKSGQTPAADFIRTKTARESGASAVAESKTALQKAKLKLANLLNLSDAEAAQLKVIADLDGPNERPRDPSPAEELIRIALAHRPDLNAYRLGVARAQLERLKALIEPLNQVTWRAWPYAMAGAGIRQQGPAAPGNMATLISLPTTVLNRGKIKRATINVEQSRTELAKVEREVILEVRQARLEYDQARSTLDRFQNEIVPGTGRIRDTLFRQFTSGEAPLTNYLTSQKEYSERISQFLEVRERVRRSALALNTAVGARIMP